MNCEKSLSYVPPVQIMNRRFTLHLIVNFESVIYGFKTSVGNSLNQVSDIFSHLDPEINIKSLLSWQNRVLGRQVLLYNSVLLLVLVLVWILVTFTEFNYNSNVLDPFWFSIVFSILGEYIQLSGLLQFSQYQVNISSFLVQYSFLNTR